MRKKQTFRRTPAGKKNRKGILFLLLLLLGVILLSLYIKMRPIVEQTATNQVKIYVTRLINDAIIHELEQTEVQYDDLVQLSRNESGQITSLQTDVVSVNRLKTSIVQGLVKELEEMGPQSVYIPLGTLSGTEWFSGRGPSIEIKLIPNGYVQSDIYNSFTSAGINQTHHQVMLRTTVQMVAIIPGYSIQTETITDFCVAETIIVGEIPDAFIQVTGDSMPAMARIEGNLN